MNYSDGLKTALFQMLPNLLSTNGLPPFDLQGNGVLSAALGDIKPLVREGATHAVENLARTDQVPDGALHHPPGGGGGKKHWLLGLKEFLKLGLDTGVEFFEISAAMSHHGFAKSGEGLFGYLNGAWDEEFHEED
jgi:hypothetical protein